jgi:hypothetical protein
VVDGSVRIILPPRPVSSNLAYRPVRSHPGVPTITIASHSFTLFNAWSEIFSDDLAAVAKVDRLFHHYVLISLKGDSYRCGNTA